MGECVKLYDFRRLIGEGQRLGELVVLGVCHQVTECLAERGLHVVLEALREASPGWLHPRVQQSDLVEPLRAVAVRRLAGSLERHLGRLSGGESVGANVLRVLPRHARLGGHLRAHRRLEIVLPELIGVGHAQSGGPHVEDLLQQHAPGRQAVIVVVGVTVLDLPGLGRVRVTKAAVALELVALLLLLLVRAALDDGTVGELENLRDVGVVRLSVLVPVQQVGQDVGGLEEVRVRVRRGSRDQKDVLFQGQEDTLGETLVLQPLALRASDVVAVAALDLELGLEVRQGGKARVLGGLSEQNAVVAFGRLRKVPDLVELRHRNVLERAQLAARRVRIVAGAVHGLPEDLEGVEEQLDLLLLHLGLAVLGLVVHDVHEVGVAEPGLVQTLTSGSVVAEPGGTQIFGHGIIRTHGKVG
mmetsp:Transcript_12150/g.36900  ORF Transcript_12150/g.36900 Transcript_12150/m.36900 type:complete len:415 (+) Transcript_12150:229-1473(+)